MKQAGNRLTVFPADAITHSPWQPTGGLMQEKPSENPADPFVHGMLVKAEALLGYVADAGIKVEDSVRDSVLNARAARAASNAGAMTEQVVAGLHVALTSLAATAKPVTSASADSTPKKARQTLRFWEIFAIITGCVILFISGLTFVVDSIAAKIQADIQTANGLGAKLRAELGPTPETGQQSVSATNATLTAVNVSQDQIWFGPGGVPSGLSDKDVISDLQQFAATAREIDGYTQQLKHYLFDSSTNHYPAAPLGRNRLELKPGLDVRLAQELTTMVVQYQDVRSSGNAVQEKITLYYGAIGTYLLPVLYALLGAGAYLLRLYEDQIKNHTLIPGDKHVARFLIAGIGGLVVGLFNNVFQAATLQPFAVAFLVGYATDVFFTFLEGFLQMFKRAPSGADAAGTPPKPAS